MCPLYIKAHFSWYVNDPVILSRLDPFQRPPGPDGDEEDEELDRTTPLDPDRTARLACPGSPHFNAVSVRLQKPAAHGPWAQLVFSHLV